MKANHLVLIYFRTVALTLILVQSPDSNCQENIYLNKEKDTQIKENIRIGLKESIQIFYDQILKKNAGSMVTRRDSSLSERYSEDEDTLLPDRKVVYVYGTDDIYPQKVIYIWDKNSGKWIFYTKTDFIRNFETNTIQQTDSTWDESTEKWLHWRNSEIILDNNGHTSQKTYYIWEADANQWINESKLSYFYNANWNESYHYVYQWNKLRDDWMFYQKIEYEYDQNNNCILFLQSSWDTLDNSWIPVWKIEYTFENNSQKILGLESTWDEAFQIWNIRGKYDDYIYGASGFKKGYTHYIFNNENPEWVADYKYEYTYNEYGDETEYTSYKWNEELNTWIVAAKYTSYYSIQSSTPVFLDRMNKIEIYPNPASDLVFLETEGSEGLRYFLIDLTGKVIKQEQVKDQITCISLNDLSPGIYYIRISGRNTEQSKLYKIIKK